MVSWTCRQKQKSKLRRSNQSSSLPISLDIVRVNAAVASLQDLLEWAAAAKRSAQEAHTVKLECFRHLSSSHGGQRRPSTRPQATPPQPPAFTSEHHRTVLAEASAKLSSDKLRGPVLEALTKVVSASSVRHLELGVKLSFKLYEQLGTLLPSNSSLEVLSLAGSCCGDQALAVILPPLTNHPKIQVLKLPGCSLTDLSATRLATLLKAQAAVAAQQAWVTGLRSDGKNSKKTRHGAACNDGGSDKTQGIRVLDVSQNQLTAEALPHLASAVAEERSSLTHLSLAGNQLPVAATSAATFLQALLQEPPERSFTVDLRDNFDGKIAVGADGAPTLPQLGVWAGTFTWDASTGVAVAAAVPQGMVQQRPSHHDSSSATPVGAGCLATQTADRPLRPSQLQQQQRPVEQGNDSSTAPPAAGNQQTVADGIPQPQQQPLSSHTPQRHTAHIQQQPQTTGNSLQQQQTHQTLLRQQHTAIMQHQQQSQEEVKKEALCPDGKTSMTHINGIKGQQHCSMEAARPQQHHRQQKHCQWQQQKQREQQTQSPASWDGAFMDEGVLEVPQPHGQPAQHLESSRSSPTADALLEKQDHSKCSSPENSCGAKRTTAAKPKADVLGSEGVLHVIMQQQQMLEMLVQQQERLQQQQHGQQQHGAIDEGLLVQLAAVLNGLSEDVDQLEHLYHVSELTKDKSAIAKANSVSPPIAAAGSHLGKAEQRAPLQTGFSQRSITALQAVDGVGAADAAAFISRIAMSPATASKAARAARSPEQQCRSSQHPRIVNDGVCWQLHSAVASSLVPVEQGQCMGKQVTSPRLPKPQDVDWHLVDEIGKQLYKLYGLS